MRWLNGRGRATYSCSDQAPFSTGSDHCLTCRSRFIVDHPTLPQAVAISTPPPEKIVRTAPSRLRPAYPAAGLFAVPDTGSRFSRIVNHPHSPPGRLRYQFKAHSTFLPNRRGFLHCTVSKPPRPPPGYIPPTIIRCGRGGPDTVLTIIGIVIVAVTFLLTPFHCPDFRVADESFKREHTCAYCICYTGSPKSPDSLNPGMHSVSG